MEPKIKNEICMGKMDRVMTSQQSGQTMWQVRTIWRCTDLCWRRDYKKECALVRWTGSWRHNSVAWPCGTQTRSGAEMIWKKGAWLRWIGSWRDVTTVRLDHVAGEDNMAEHSLMMEPKIKKEICLGKMEGVMTSQQSGRTTWQVRTKCIMMSYVGFLHTHAPQPWKSSQLIIPGR